jgi:hypothetical protein
VTSTGWMRNYRAMSDTKLAQTIQEFQRGYGVAIQKVEAKGGSIEDNKAKAIYEARLRPALRAQFDLDGEIVADTNAKTVAQFCPECERKKPFYLDDYICVSCRDSM